ncbi:MAG: hypothetical protein ACI91O_001325 [Candidatus Poriferisodalaceae bacterium]
MFDLEHDAPATRPPERIERLGDPEDRPEENELSKDRASQDTGAKNSGVSTSGTKSTASGGSTAPSDPDTTSAVSSKALPEPADYLAELCNDAQIVLLGDQRHVAQHLGFVASFLPRLHAAGITNFAWEFTNSRAQDNLDALLAGGSWNQSLCNDLFVDLMGIGLGYEQYAEVLRSAWKINQTLREGEKPMRVIALGLPSYVEDPELLDGRSAGELELRNWWLGGHYRDITAFHMTNVLTTEVIRAGERALVYGDAARTTTAVTEWADGHAVTSLGNLLHRWMGEGVRRVLFHGALNDDTALDRIESLIAAAPEDAEQFGLDIGRSTLGNVGVPAVKGCIAGEHTEFRLGDIADGYIFIAPRSQWRPVDLIPDFVAPRNLREAEQRYRALDPRVEPYTLGELEIVRSDGHHDIEAGWPGVPELPQEEPVVAKKWFRRG